MKKISLLIFLFLIQYISACAQTFPIFKLTPKDGLANSIVYRITQDKKGFIWFSTNNGISRYDGTNFKNFGVREGLSYPAVLSVSESENEEKWIANYRGGLSILKGEQFYKLFGKNELPNPILFTQFNKDRVWCISQKGDLHLITKNNNDTFINRINYPDVFFLNFLKTDSALLITSEKGLYIASSGDVKEYLRNIISEKVYAADYNTKRETLIVALKAQILFIKENEVYKSVNLPPGQEVSDLLLDKKGQLWIAEKGVVLLYSKNKLEDISYKFKLNNVLVNDLFEDSNGNIWGATYGEGVFCITTTQIVNYSHLENKAINNINFVSTVGGEVLAGGFGDMYSFKKDIPKKEFHQYMLPSDYIYFFKEYDSILYIGTNRKVFFKNLKNGNEGVFANSEGTSICIDKENKVLVGGFNGLFVYDRKGKGGKEKNFEELNHRINSIACDDEGAVYLGTDSGLFIKNEDKLKHVSITKYLPSNTVNYVLCGSHKQIWLATNSGVYTYNKLNNKVEAVFEPILRNIKCTSIDEDSQGNIWIGSFKGVFKISNGGIYSYNTSTGLISNEVLSLALHKKSLWVGTVNGVSKVVIEKKVNETQDIPFYITQIQTGSAKVYNFPKSISTSYKDADIKISYIGLDFPKANNLQYQYRIRNKSQLWRSTNLTEVELPSLAAGEYLFQVRVKKNNGEWSAPKSVQVIITPPFWKESWFLVLATVLGVSMLLLLLYGYLRLDRKKHIKQAVIREQTTILKQKALRSMINPHFVFNCLNNVLGHIQKDEKDIAKNYLTQFSKFFRMTLEQSKYEYISLLDEVKRLELYLKMEQLRFGKRLNTCINVEVSDENIVLPNMVIQPFVENSIIHGVMPENGKGEISITFGEQGESLKVSIEDNGGGFDEDFLKDSFEGATDKTSLGIKLSFDRLNLLEDVSKKKNSIIFSKSDKLGGARVEILIPLMYS